MTHIDICICTYRRESLVDTVRSLAALDLPERVNFQVIIADNDSNPSAQQRVSDLQNEFDFPIVYIHAPEKNISIARNACLEAASSDWIVFIDDDEIVDTRWLITILEKAERENLTAVFGPAYAKYDDDSPEWIIAKDYHSNIPESRNGEIETGHTCNVLMRRDDSALTGLRFLLSKGKTGGEDTEYFFRAKRKGAKFGIESSAKVYEKVDPSRLSYRWIAKRKFRSGQSYGYHSAGEHRLKKLWVTLSALGKCAVCVIVSLLFFWSQTQRNYWTLRAVFHAGVVTSYLGLVESELY